MAYAWSRILCVKAVRERAYVFRFQYFLLVPCPVCYWSSPNTASYVHSCSKPLRQGKYPLYRAWLWSRVTRKGPSPETPVSAFACLWYVSPRHFFSAAYSFVHVMCMIYLSRVSAVYSVKPVGLGNAVHDHRCNRTSLVAKSESVLHGGICELMSMTLLLCSAYLTSYQYRQVPRFSLHCSSVQAKLIVLFYWTNLLATIFFRKLAWQRQSPVLFLFHTANIFLPARPCVCSVWYKHVLCSSTV